MDFSNFHLFIGRFHPLFVHLPIGFIFFGIILEIVGKLKIFQPDHKSIELSYIVGAASAIISCLLGYLLAYDNNDYSYEAISFHQWFGIITTVLIIGMFFLRKYNIQKVYDFSLLVIVFTISITGHYGGNLTHGSTYLTQYVPLKFNDTEIVISPPNNANEVIMYEHIIQPILQQKCISCHNTEKKKGELSLSNKADILKGGKTKNLIVQGESNHSEIIQRILLPHGDEDIMPPEGKTPLTDKEVELLISWIDIGHGSFDTLITEIPLSEELMTYCNTKLGFISNHNSIALIDYDTSIVQDLRNKGFQIREIDKNAFDVSYPKLSNIDLISALLPIKDNIIWLDLKAQNIQRPDELQQFSELRKLNLSKNPIGDDKVNIFKTMKKLETINLHSTLISSHGIKELKDNSSIKTIYSWNTKL
ncbi:c-type cytochrome domain-containing protein [Flammeovirga sp. SubArs3]|uniref:c-type cytochrome domain-containing protein n=1 Tax=Flammeovirga sp. SubArs3 TaxID=2995316 RepID=UPI00248BD60E|nr:c-type cytochrome domain-containing protein [Flammeovirga sp. SubArs3]